MILSQEQLKAVVSSGGGLVVDATTLTFNQLRALAQAANVGRGPLTVRRCAGLTAEQLALLANAAPGLVVFDLTD